MATAYEPQLMTAEQFLALPDDGKERWLIRGELREHGMTVRNELHSMVMAAIAAALIQWRKQLSAPRGDVVCGEAGVRLGGHPETVVGVDVAFLPPKAAASVKSTTLIHRIPILAVEILSPSDTYEAIGEKRDLYLAAGVKLVWIIDPAAQTITIFEINQPPRLVNRTQELTAEPHLPGFRVAVHELFE